MKACVVFGAGDVRSSEVSQPLEAEDRIIVDVAYGGICGSDVHYAINGRNGDYVLKEPLILGHEISGRVSWVGSKVADPPPLGSGVVVHPATPCPPPASWLLEKGLAAEDTHLSGTYFGSASTFPHTQGAFAQQISVRPEQLRLLPAGLDLRRAALAEPLAVALHAVAMLGDIRGKSVLVSGAGPIGLLTVIALRRAGAGEIVASDIQDSALAIARRVGATRTVCVGRDEGVPDGGVDAVVEAAGSPAALREGLRVVRSGGSIVQLGIVPSGDIGLPLLQLLTREISLRGTWRFHDELDDAVALLSIAPEADDVITHEFGFDELDLAFAVARDAAVSSKVLLDLMR